LSADRGAGNAISPKPPRRLLGKVGTVRRPLSGWDAYWVSFGMGRRRSNLRNGPGRTEYPDEYVFAAEELRLERRAT